MLKRILPRLTFANVVEGREAEARRPSALATPIGAKAVALEANRRVTAPDEERVRRCSLS